MTLPETRNPFKAGSGRIVGTSVLPSAYHRAEHKRGSRDYVMSRSALMDFAACPAKWLAGAQDGDETGDTAATAWGSLMDGLITLPAEQFDELFAVCPDTYGDKPWNLNATYCKEWAADQGGKQIVKEPLFRKAQEAVQRLLDDEEFAQIVLASQKQVHVEAQYQDRATGIVVPFKILVDLLPPKEHETLGKSLIDFKTCRDASLRKWQRDVEEYGYQTQGATYLDVFNAVDGEDRQDFRHILSESEHPWQPGWRCLSLENVQVGRLEYTGALERYCRCLETGEWPGYEAQAQLRIDGKWAMVDPTPWKLKELV